MRAGHPPLAGTSRAVEIKVPALTNRRMTFSSHWSKGGGPMDYFSTALNDLIAFVFCWLPTNKTFHSLSST